MASGYGLWLIFLRISGQNSFTTNVIVSCPTCVPHTLAVFGSVRSARGWYLHMEIPAEVALPKISESLNCLPHESVGVIKILLTAWPKQCRNLPLLDW